ncbi:MAG: YXWGXW repeat-containing protein [Proteobacteria bacterium]|nr:YXWGXW repeat-containing protein [Pseudomonadota bacterium]
MHRHRLFWPLLVGLASGLAACSSPASATHDVVVETGVPPPTPRPEHVRERAGYVWEPGYYRWDTHDRRHVWVGGHFVPARPGREWVPALWRKEGNGLWRFQQGHWRPG